MPYVATSNFYAVDRVYEVGNPVEIEDKDVLKKLVDEGKVAEYSGDTPPSGFPDKTVEAAQSQPPLEDQPQAVTPPANPQTTEEKIQADLAQLDNESEQS